MNTATDITTKRVITEASLQYEPQEQTIKLPAAAHVIGVRSGIDGIKLFVECNPHLPDADRRFVVVGSNEQLPEPRSEHRYIGTLDETPPRHIFERRS